MEDAHSMNEPIIDLQEELDTQSVSESSFCSSSSSCMTSVTDLSIYHEFDCMIAELHAIQESHHNTIDHLCRLQASLESSTDDEEEQQEPEEELSKFYEIVKEFHTEALKEIDSSLPSTFTDQLLKWIDTISSERESEYESE